MLPPQPENFLARVLRVSLALVSAYAPPMVRDLEQAFVVSDGNGEAMAFGYA